MAPKKKPKKLSLGPAPLASFDTELESEADQQSNSDEGSPSSEESKSQTGSIKQESGDLPNDQVGDDDDTPTPTNQDFEGIMDFPSEEKDSESSLQIESLPQTPKQEVETPTLSEYTSKINGESKKEIEVPKQEEVTKESTINKLQEESPMQDVGTKPKIPVRAAPKIPPVKKVELGIQKSDMIDQVDSISKEKIELVDRIEKVILKESEIDKNGTFEKSDISIEDKPKSPLAQVKKKMLWGGSPPKFGAIPKISLTKSLKKEEKAENYGKPSQKIDEYKKLKKDDKKKEKHEEKQKLEKLKEEKRIEEKRKEELRKAKMKEEKKKKEEKRKAEEKRREEKRKEDKKQQELKLEQKKKAKKKKELTEIVKKREKIEEVIEEFKKVTKESIKRKEMLAEREKVEIIEEINISVPVVNGEVEIAGEKVDEVISNLNGAEQEKIVTVAVIETGLKPRVDVVADEKETKESESSDDERELTESEIETEPIQHDIPKIEDSEHAEIADKLITQESVDYDDEQFPMLENIPVTPTLSISTHRKRFDVVTIPIQRPRASTPIQIASLEDYITIASGMEKSYEMEKIKILLPEEEFIAKPTKSPKRTSSKSWFDFCEGGLQSPRILRSPQLSDSSSPTIGSPAKLPLSPRSEVKSSKPWVMFSENEKVSPVEPDAEARMSDEEVEVFMEDGNISADIESMTEDDSKKEQIICRIKLKTRHHSEDHSSEEETTSKKEGDGSSSDSDETIHNSEESLGESDSTLEDGWQAFERTRAVKVGVKKGDHLTNEMLLPNRGRLGSTGVTDGETDLEPVWVDSPDFFTQSGEAIISEEHIPSPDEILDEKDVNQPLKRQDTKGKILMKQSRALDIEDKFLTESIMQESTVELEKELIVTEEKFIKDESLGPSIIDEYIVEAEIHSISEVSKDEISKEVEIRIEELNVTESPSPAYDFLNIELHIVESSENLAEINKIENEEKFTEEVDDEIPPVKAEIPSAASYPQLPIDLVSSETNVLSKAYTSIDRVNELDSGLYSWTRTTAVSAAEVDSEIDLKSEENKRTYSLGELAALTEEAKIEDKDEDEHEESVDEIVFSSEPSYISFSLDQHPLEVVDKQHPIAGLFIEEVDYSYPVDDSISQSIKTYEVSQDYSQYQPNEELSYEYQQDLQYSYQKQEVVHGQPTRWDDVEEEIMPERISKVKFEEPTLTTISYLPSSDETHIEDVAEQVELEDVSQKIEVVADSTLSSYIYSIPYVYSPETRPPPPEESPPPPPEESPSPPPDEILSPPSVLPQESQLRPIRKAPPPPPRKTFEYDSSYAQNYYDSSKYDYAPSDVYYPSDGYGDAPPPSSTVGSLQLAAPSGQLTASFLNLFDPAVSTLDFSKSQTNGLELDSEFPAIETPDVNGQNLFEEVFLPMKLPTAAPASSLNDQSQQPVSDIFETLQEIQGELPAAPAPPAAKFDDWPTGTFTRRDSGIRFPRKQVRTESQADIDDFIGGQTEAVSQTKVVHDDLLSLDEHQAKEVSKSYDYQEESTFHEGKPKNVFKALADIKPWKKKKKKFHPKPVNLAKLVGSEHVMISKKKKKGKGGIDSDDRLFESFSSVPHKDESFDKESEDWLAFQRMTQRVSETVQKTKTNLDKIVVTSAVDSQATIKKIEPEKEQVEVKTAKSSWVCFDDDFISSSADSSAAPSRIETPTHTPNVHSPKPPLNSLRDSLTDLSQEVEESVDILGLGDILSQTTMSASKSILEQDLDLLGLGCDSFTDVKSVSTGSLSLMDDPFGLERSDTSSHPVSHSKDLFDFEDSVTTSMISQPELFDITSTTSKSSTDMGGWDIFGSTSAAPVKETQNDNLFMDPFSVNISENIATKSWTMSDTSLEDKPFSASPKPSPRHSLTGGSIGSPSQATWSTFDEGHIKQTPPSSRKASGIFQDPFAFSVSTSTPTKQNIFSMPTTQQVSKPTDPFLITDSFSTVISNSSTEPFHSVSHSEDPFSHLDSKPALSKSSESDPFDTMHILDQTKNNVWLGFETADTLQSTVTTSSSQAAASDLFGSLSSCVSSKDQFGTTSVHDLFGTSVQFPSSAQDLFSTSDITSHDFFSSPPMTITSSSELLESKNVLESSKDVSWQTFGSSAFTKTDKDNLFDTIQMTTKHAAPAWPSFDESDTMDTTTLVPKSSPKEHDFKSVSKVTSDAWPSDSGSVESKTKLPMDPFISGRDSDPLLSHSDAAADPFSDSTNDWTKQLDDGVSAKPELLESPDKSESFDQTSSFSQPSSKSEMAFVSDDTFNVQKSLPKVSEGYFGFDDSDSALSTQKMNRPDHGDPFACSGLPETDSTSQNPFAVSLEPVLESVSHNPFLQTIDQGFSDVDTSLDTATVEPASPFHGDLQSSTLFQLSDNFDPFTTKSPSITPGRIAPLPPPLKMPEPAEASSHFDVFDIEKSEVPISLKQTVEGFDNDTFDPFAVSKPSADAFGLDQFGDDSDGLTSPPATQTRFNPFDKEVAFPEGVVTELPQATEEADVPESPCSYKPESPLFDEDDSEPLEDFPPRWEGDGWEMMLRLPSKKKITGSRYWKKVYVRLADNNVVQLFNSKDETEPFQELPLQACYSISHVAAQQYDAYGKIHTIKLQLNASLKNTRTTCPPQRENSHIENS